MCQKYKPTIISNLTANVKRSRISRKLGQAYLIQDKSENATLHKTKFEKSETVSPGRWSKMKEKQDTDGDIWCNNLFLASFPTFPEIFKKVSINKFSYIC